MAFLSALKGDDGGPLVVRFGSQAFVAGFGGKLGHGHLYAYQQAASYADWVRSEIS